MVVSNLSWKFEGKADKRSKYMFAKKPAYLHGLILYVNLQCIQCMKRMKNRKRINMRRKKNNALAKERKKKGIREKRKYEK